MKPVMPFVKRSVALGNEVGKIRNNQAFLKAKNERNDEFYTQYEDIEAELRHYASFLSGKSIYLPCDNPYHSQFFAYFMAHFNRLNLKQVIATCYDASFGQLSLFEDYDDQQELIVRPKKAYFALIREVEEPTNIEALARLPTNTFGRLEGNGDFTSEECLNLMKTADVIVTNPPFSLFRVLLGFLRRFEKDYLLLGAAQAITYTEAFQLFQGGQLHLGVLPFSNSLSFEVPAGTPYDKIKAGKFYKQVSIAWFTSFPVERPVQALRLTQTFSPERYAHLDDDASIINVDALVDIPKDYRGKMAVPITFLKVWDKSEFELLGQLTKAMVGGKEKFTRLLIQRKETTSNETKRTGKSLSNGY